MTDRQAEITTDKWAETLAESTLWSQVSLEAEWLAVIVSHRPRLRATQPPHEPSCLAMCSPAECGPARQPQRLRCQRSAGSGLCTYSKDCPSACPPGTGAVQDRGGPNGGIVFSNSRWSGSAPLPCGVGRLRLRWQNISKETPGGPGDCPSAWEVLPLKWHERCTICNIKLIYSSEMRFGICKECRRWL